MGFDIQAILRRTTQVLSARAGQQGAVANARAAATDLARRRLEHEEVELYLRRRRAAAPAPRARRAAL
ncbi:hypothetical protein ACFP3Q_06820 [Nocardioides sp. GCM10027113]|uniref:hypothetical protein n=1 Tax=unclassified Nocardioides TaxID=2615069 RepID=UPI00361AF051